MRKRQKAAPLPLIPENIKNMIDFQNVWSQASEFTNMKKAQMNQL